MCHYTLLNPVLQVSRDAAESCFAAGLQRFSLLDISTGCLVAFTTVVEIRLRVLLISVGHHLLCVCLSLMKQMDCQAMHSSVTLYGHWGKALHQRMPPLDMSDWLMAGEPGNLN